MTLPTIEEIEKLWDEYKVPSNIRAHMKKTAEVAVFIGERFLEKGIKVNVELVEKAALLHDLIRVCNFKTFDHKGYRAVPPTEEELRKWTELKEKYGEVHHATAVYEELKNRYPEAARVAMKHRGSKLGTPEGPKTWEEKIVNYADKVVSHDKITRIKERYEDFYVRHPERDQEGLKEKIRQATKLEKEICSTIGIEPDKIGEILG